MAWTRAALALLVAGAAAVALVSGGSAADPRTPPALPDLAQPFLGTAALGSGGLAAAVDAYGNVVDLRAPGPAGRALIENPAARQATGTVAADTGIVPRVRVGGAWLPLWRADSVQQRYRPGTNVLIVSAAFGETRVRIAYAADLPTPDGPGMNTTTDRPALAASNAVVSARKCASRPTRSGLGVTSFPSA